MSLAAAPICAVMVLVSATHHGAESAMCSNMSTLPYPGSMGMMYALMGLFHIGPWLTLHARLSGQLVMSESE
jgi:hypothetical protein